MLKNNKKDKNRKHEKVSTKTKGKMLKRILIIIGVLILLACLIVGGVVAGTLCGLFSDDLKISSEDLVLEFENSVVYDINGNEIAQLSGDEKRQIVSLSDMAPHLADAYVSIEDERFLTHPGFDFKRTASATVKYVLSKVGIGSASYGGSTITQQVIKNITKEDERDWTRKVKEITRAIQIERIMSKDEILQLYLNLIFVGGDDIHGVSLGAKYYFNKDVKDLSLAECAFLAGINHSPNAYNPFKEDDKQQSRLELGQKRAKVVLNKMQQLGKITESECNIAIAEIDKGFTFEKGNTGTSSQYSYHTEAAINQLIEQIMEEKGVNRDMAKTMLYGGGYAIYTTEDPNVQSILEEEFNKDKYVVAPKGAVDDNGNQITSQAAMVIIDHSNGYVVGCVGGLGEKTTTGDWNRATQSVKQTGSAMKPLAVIGPALESGLITAGSVYDDSPTTEFTGKTWPKNYYSGWKGLSTVRYAIEISQNIVPVRIINELGIDKSVEFLEKMGFEHLKNEGLSLALGGLTNGATPLEMAAGYAMIANNGVYIEPTFYVKVEDKEHNIVYEPDLTETRVLTESNAYILKSILTQPVVGAAGTAKYCKITGMDTCAKTGTTSDDYDRWLCGFTPYYSAATWFGYDKNREVDYSGNPAGKIWAAVMELAHQELENKSFEVPGDIVRVAICRDSGLRAGEYCSQDQRGSRVYTEVFVDGTQPGEVCDCHVKLNVCEETGALVIDGKCKSVERIFITRPNDDRYTNWERANDAGFMAPVDQCTIHILNSANPSSNLISNEIISNIISNDILNESVIENTIQNEIVPENTITNEVDSENIVEETPNTNTTIENTTVEENESDEENNRSRGERRTSIEE